MFQERRQDKTRKDARVKKSLIGNQANSAEFPAAIVILYMYSRSSRKRSPRKFQKNGLNQSCSLSKTIEGGRLRELQTLIILMIHKENKINLLTLYLK